MLKAVFTLDYEIHGDGQGCPLSLMVQPTQRILDQFDRYGAKLTIMADVAEILKFKDYKERIGRDDYHYDAIVNQLKYAVGRGHDVQLHLHSSYFNARYEGGRWVQDWSEYNFAGLSLARLNEIVRIGREYLEALLKPVLHTYECVAFRAGNWAVNPSRNVICALHDNGIRIDTSVFKDGRRTGIVNFDYSHAYSDLVPWRVTDDDICLRDDGGKLLEIPIYSERRWVGAFVTPSRIYRAMQTQSHRIANNQRSRTTGGSVKEKLLGRLAILGRHAWKADFNQCTGRQLIRAIERAEVRHSSRSECLPFVLIGHSKLFTPFNERTLAPFLAMIERQPNSVRIC